MSSETPVGDQPAELREIDSDLGMTAILAASEQLDVLCRRIGSLEHSQLEHMLASLRAVQSDEYIRERLEAHLSVTDWAHREQSIDPSNYASNLEFLATRYPSILNACFRRACRQAQPTSVKILVDLGADIYCDDGDSFLEIGTSLTRSGCSQSFIGPDPAFVGALRTYLIEESIARNGPRYLMDEDMPYVISLDPSGARTVSCYRTIAEDDKLRILAMVPSLSKSARK